MDQRQHDHDREVFLAVKGLLGATGKAAEPGVIDAYVEALEGIPLETIKGGCVWVASTCDDFAPRPAVLIQLLKRYQAQQELAAARKSREPDLGGPRRPCPDCESGHVKCWHPKTVQECRQKLRAGEPRVKLNSYGLEVGNYQHYEIAVPCHCPLGDRHAVWKWQGEIRQLPRYNHDRFCRHQWTKQERVEALWAFAQRWNETEDKRTDFAAAHGGWV